MNIQDIAKFLLIGRDFQFFDKIIYYFSGKKSSGWIIGNKIRALVYGKKKYISKKPIVLIGGYPRSGTTLLRALLEQHKNIASPGREINILEDIKTEHYLKSGFEFSDKEIRFLKKYEKDVILFAEKVFDLYGKKNKAKYVLLKQPKHIFLIDEIFKSFPNVKFIHIIREGRDATMSQRYYLLPKNKKEWPYEWCCRQWVASINKGKKFRNDPRYIEVFYEDLIKKPRETLNKIFNFLGLKNLSKNQIENFYKKVNIQKHEDHPEVGTPLDVKKINKWVSKMSANDKKIFKHIAGQTLIDLGYEKNNEW